MEQQERHEQLRLVAEFAGAKTSEPYPYNKDTGYHTYHFEFPSDKDNPMSFPDNQKHHTISALKYDTSWDWLMPVAKEIKNAMESLSDNSAFSNVPETKSKLTSLKLNFSSAINGLELNEVFAAVVQFVTWYKLIIK